MEEWRPVVGWEHQYIVSDHGRCARVMKIGAHQHGYSKIHLGEQSVNRYTNVHILVAEAFLGPRPEGHEVNHRDGDKTVNHVNNLEYVTKSRNKRHAITIGQAAVGERSGKSKLTKKQVIEIRRKHLNGSSYSQLARQFHVNKSTIANIIRDRTWKHLGREIIQIKTTPPAIEEWRTIPEAESYLVSNLGRVAHLLSMTLNQNRYRMAIFTTENGSASIYIHRLVAQAFLPTYTDDCLIFQKDRDTLNAHVHNLECLSPSEHAHRRSDDLGAYTGNAGNRGSTNTYAKLTEDTVRELRQLYPTGRFSFEQLAKRYGVTKQAVWMAYHRKTWTHIE